MRSPAAACLPHSILLLSASFARPLRVAPPSPRASVRCSAASFAELGLRAETIDALDRLGVVAPNELQARAMPALAGRGDLIVGAQTGSGKTLTYLVPIMQTLKADEEAAGARAKPKRPRALVLVPTRELAVQVHEVGRTLGQSLRLSVKAVSGGTPVAPQALQTVCAARPLCRLLCRLLCRPPLCRPPHPCPLRLCAARAPSPPPRLAAQRRARRATLSPRHPLPAPASRASSLSPTPAGRGPSCAPLTC